MAIPPKKLRFIERIRERLSPNDARDRLKPRFDKLVPLMTIPQASASTVQRIWNRLRRSGVDEMAQSRLADDQSVASASVFSRNIENYIGTVKVPIGVVGPLQVNGINANGDYFVPLATTEAALVASYARGAAVVGKAGGISVGLLSEGILRAPAFRFSSLSDAGLFVNWIADQTENLITAAESTTRHGKLVSLDPHIDGEIVFLLSRFTTGDASGQNMVTFATEAMCRYILDHAPIKPKSWFLEANFSGDKKASFLGLTYGRGRRVTAQVEIPANLIEDMLGVTIAQILEYGRIANLGSLMTGQLGAQAHVANGLAALYLATGQDVACVAESAVGFTRMEDTGGKLLVTLTLPNILVGTIGGGTGLPSQSAALDVLGLRGDGKAAALAEVTAALCLCGELSLTAAVAGGQFGSAHKRLARGKQA